MSNVLLDFIDKLVDRDDSEDAILQSDDENQLRVNGLASSSSASNATEGFDDAYVLESEYCSIPTEIFEEFSAEKFRNTNIIQWMHSTPPRFGKSSDVLDLAIGTTEQQQAPPSGSNSTRWLGGQPLRMPSPPLGRSKNEKRYCSDKGETEDFKEWKREYNSTKMQLIGFRIIVWMAGLSIAIAALVMSVYGVDSLNNTLEAGRESLGIVKKLAGNANTIVDSVIRQNEDLSNKVYGMLESVNGMCPKVRDPLCDDIYDVQTCDIASFLGSDLNDVFQLAAGHFVEGEQSEYYQEILNAKNGLEDFQSLSQDMDQSASHLYWALTLSMVMSLLLAILCLLVLCGLVCPDMPRVLQCLQSKLMVPTFVVLVVFAYLFSAVFVTASVATADVCVYHSPTDNIDERILSVLTHSRDVEDLLGGKETKNLVTEFIAFYIHQCPVELLPQEIREQLQYVKAGVPVLKQFSTIVEQSINLIQDVCGFEEDQTQNLVDVTDILQDQLCAVADIVSDVREFVQCHNWYPLYETTVYEALCYDGTEGFAYVATTQFVITFMAFVILTFRVAFWDIQVGDQYYNFVDDDDDDDGDAYIENSEGSDAVYSEGGGWELDDDDDHHHGSYYKGFRNKIAAKRSSSMEQQLEELRQQQWQESQELQRVVDATSAAETSTPTKPSLFGLSLGSFSFDNLTAVSTPGTNSMSSCEEDSPQEAQATIGSDNSTGVPSLNSSYLSRFPWNNRSTGTAGNHSHDGNRDGNDTDTDCGSLVRGKEREFTIPMCQPVLGDFGEWCTMLDVNVNPSDGGIEVEHVSGYIGRSESYVLDNSSNGNGSDSSKSRNRPSRTVDATSLWVRQHQDNIDYHDSDDSDEDYT
eukprot:jgi/Psemu1/66506/estExt_Genemark1.C_2120035